MKDDGQNINPADNKKMKPSTTSDSDESEDECYESDDYEVPTKFIYRTRFYISESEDESLLEDTQENTQEDTKEDTQEGSQEDSFMAIVKAILQIRTNTNDQENTQQIVDSRDYEDEETYYDTNYFIQNPFYQRDSHDHLEYIDNAHTALCDISIVLADTFRERLFMKTIKFPPKQTSLQKNFCFSRSFSIPNIRVILAIQIDSKKQLLFVYCASCKLSILNLLTNEIVSERSVEHRYAKAWRDFRLSRNNSIIAITGQGIFKFNNTNNFSDPLWEKEICYITGLTIELDSSIQKHDLCCH